MLNQLINQGYAVEASQIETIQAVADFKSVLLSQIKAARHRILMNCLYFENDESGQEILTALTDAVRANPQLVVDVFVDLHRAMRGRIGAEVKLTNACWYYQALHQLNQQLVQEHKLTRNPINFYGVPCNARELFGVYHIKGYVFDDTILYTGASVNNNYLGYSTYRQDRYQLISDPELAQSFYEFTMRNFAHEMPVGYSPTLLNQHHARAVLHLSAHETKFTSKQQRLDFKSYRQNVLLSNSLQYRWNPQAQLGNSLLNHQVAISPIYGLGRDNLLNQCIFDAIAQAKEQIVIYTPYFNFTKRLTTKLMQRCKQGIKVTIIVSDKQANDFYTPPTSQNYTAANALPYLYEINLSKFTKKFQGLLNSGQLQIYCWSDNFNSYHCKGVIIDNQTYIFTGSNLNLRSFNVDTENALICYDPYQNLKKQFEAELEFMLANCRKLASYKDIETKAEYPQRVRKTLRNASILFLDKIAKRLF